MGWKLKDKNGKFRSRRSFKQDCNQDSQEEWELRRRKKKKNNIFDEIAEDMIKKF